MPIEVLNNILDFLSHIDGLKTVTTSNATLSNFGPYIIQRLQNGKLKYTSIHTTSTHTLSLTKDGSLCSWGHNACGQLGLGHNDGSLYTWVENEEGQLGLGHNNDQYIPIRVDSKHFPNKKIKSIHGGYYHTLALMEDGSLYA